jgi:diadenosine tetraphosphatase ApaH/serine/threonine PP2A family protein phosphatase
MKWAILSDVHANLEALAAVVEDLKREEIERVAFLGDIVGYGANPSECVTALNDLTEVVVAGNHDFGAVGQTDVSAFNEVAKAAIHWTGEKISESDRTFLRQLPLLRRVENFTFVHATPHEPEEWNYISSLDEAEKGFKAIATPLVFVGHSHRPVIFVEEKSGEVKAARETEVALESGKRYLINVGSVGQPRDRNPEAAYGLLDESSGEYRLKRVPYDVQSAQEKILRAGLPFFLADRLSRGL